MRLKTEHTKREPADHLLLLHTLLVVHRDHECDVRQLKQRHLQHEGFLEQWVGLASPRRRLATLQLLSSRRHERHLDVGVCSQRTLGLNGLSRTWLLLLYLPS